MTNPRQYLTDKKCPVCFSRVYQDTVENCTHADHEGEPVYSIGVGVWCENEKCKHYTHGLDADDLDDGSLTMADLTKAAMTLSEDVDRVALTIGDVMQIQTHNRSHIGNPQPQCSFCFPSPPPHGQES